MWRARSLHDEVITNQLSLPAENEKHTWNQKSPRKLILRFRQPEMWRRVVGSRCQRFRGICCLNLLHWRQISPKRRVISTKIRGVIFCEAGLMQTASSTSSAHCAARCRRNKNTSRINTVVKYISSGFEIGFLGRICDRSSVIWTRFSFVGWRTALSSIKMTAYRRRSCLTGL